MKFSVSFHVLGKHRVARTLRVARQLQIFLGDVRRVAANLHVWTVGFEVPAQRIDVLAPAIVVPAALAVLVILVWSHWSLYAFKMSLERLVVPGPPRRWRPERRPKGRDLVRELFGLNHFWLITSGRVPYPGYPCWHFQHRR